MATTNRNGILRGRLLLIGGVIVTMMLILLGRLCYLQVFKVHILSQKASDQSIRKIRVSPCRGRIYASQGQVLVDNRPSYNVSFHLSEMRQPGARDRTIDYILKTASRIGTEIDRAQPLTEGKIKRRLKVYPALSWDVYEDLDRKELSIAAEMMPHIDGVEITADFARNYHYPGIATHILGFTGRRRPPDSLRNSNYSYVMPELRGRAGIEKVFDNILAGRAGIKMVRVGSLGYAREKLSNPLQPQRGSDIYLTIDIKAQKIAEDLLGDRQGAFVVVDVQTGALKVMASSPTYDASRLDGRYYADLASQTEKRPLVNRAAGQSYLPGSIVKPLVGLAALESGKVTEEHKVYCDGEYEVGNTSISCWRRYGHGELDMMHAIKQSCNSYFIDVGMTAGVNNLHAMFKRAGFGTDPGIELSGVTSGRVPSPSWMRQKFDRSWLPIDTAFLSIGQFALNISPLQAAVYTAALANGGTVYRPYIVREIKSASGDILQHTAPMPANHLPVSNENLEVIQKGMYLVVNSDSGTAEAAANNAVSVAGKTGTAQVLTPGDKHNNAWFTGYAPVKRPRYAFTVLIEYGNSGGRTAAPLAGEFLQRWLGDSGQGR